MTTNSKIFLYGSLFCCFCIVGSRFIAPAPLLVLTPYLIADRAGSHLSHQLGFQYDSPTDRQMRLSRDVIGLASICFYYVLGFLPFALLPESFRRKQVFSSVWLLLAFIGGFVLAFVGFHVIDISIPVSG